jgi:hypothetical protein
MFTSLSVGNRSAMNSDLIPLGLIILWGLYAD